MRLALALLAAPIMALLALAAFDALALRAERARLSAPPVVFDPAVLEGQPEPVRQMFLALLEPGAKVCPVSEVSMTGTFRLGTAEAPRPFAMRATERLGLQGFTFAMRAHAGAMRLSGSDSLGWTRFSLYGLVPVARAGGNTDHRRAAFGRLAAELVFWAPAALLPGPGVAWEALADDHLRVTLTEGGLAQPVDVQLGADHLPRSVSLLRWSDANPERRFRLQPFGGVLGGWQSFGGTRAPTEVEAGNFFGTPDYFPFFTARVTGLTCA